MRLRRKHGGIAACAGTTLLVAVVTAGAVLAGRDDGEPAGPYTTWEQRPWIVSAISADQRTVILSYSAGGCSSARGRVEFEETGESVQVTSVQSRERRNADCLLFESGGEATVRLRRPLGGRPVQGASDGRSPPVPRRSFTRATAASSSSSSV